MSDSPEEHGRPVSCANDELGRLRAQHAATVQALQAAIRDVTRLTRLFAILNEPAPLERLLDRVLATLSELFLCDVVVLLKGGAEGGLVLLAAIGLPANMQKRALFSSDSSYTTTALKGGQPTTVAQARVDPKVDAYLRDLDVETAVWLPVSGDEGSSRGVLVLARCQPVPFVQADVDLLAVMAYRIGLMIERSLAEEERRRLEHRLRQAQKTESLGRMAAAIAHHFNNMLGAAIGSLDLALEDLPSDDRVREDVLNARESAGRAAKTSELMLAYLGQTVGNRETVDLTQVLRDALPALEASIPRNARLILDLRESGLIVLVGPAQITQMFGNLITNAWESMGGAKGEIRVSVRAVSSARIPKTHLASADFKARAASYVCLEVRDTGCGMAAETIEKIFDPFFTTKFLGRGLGLPVVLGTVRAYDGVISVESVIGQGSTFRVYLPHAPLALLEGRSTASMAHLSEGDGAKAGIVLVAEDEESLLRATQRMFERMGYLVVSATDGATAVERFRDRAKDVRLVLLDLAMPQMDGWATLEAVRSLRPDIPVILTSGYDEADAFRGQPSHHSLHFLHKPYSFAELRSAVAKTLAAAEDHAR